jgi:PHD/YefM family antitoxin component YafN of YafNO toxin-antitoxin module
VAIKRQSMVLAQMQSAPVVLLSRSTPTAVLVSPAQWNEMARELRKYRARETAARRAQEIDENPDILISFSQEELIKQDLIDG